MTPNDESTAFERASAPWLFRLHAMPRWLLALVLVATLLTGLILQNVIGGALLLLLALFLAWLAAIGWRHLSLSAKLLRLLAVGLILVAAISRLT